MEQECSSDSSEEDEGEPTCPWVRTNSGKPGLLLETAEDEFETIALIETEDGKQAYRSQKSYRLSSELTQRLKITPSGNYVPVANMTKKEPEVKKVSQPLSWIGLATSSLRLLSSMTNQRQ